MMLSREEGEGKAERERGKKIKRVEKRGRGKDNVRIENGAEKNRR